MADIINDTPSSKTIDNDNPWADPELPDNINDHEFNTGNTIKLLCNNEIIETQIYQINKDKEILLVQNGISNKFEWISFSSSRLNPPLIIWDKICMELIESGIPQQDIQYVERVLYEKERNESSMHIFKAMIYILQNKKQQAKEGLIKNKGTISQQRINDCYQNEIQLPNTTEYNLKIKNMNEKYYINNMIEWSDYNKLQINDIIDFRNENGKFILSKVVKKKGIILVLDTTESKQVTINYLNQYPYQRLFKGGAVTERVPQYFKRKTIKLGAKISINGRYVSSKYDDWAEGIIIDTINNTSNANQVKQIKIKFCKTETIWVHLDNKYELKYDVNLLYASALTGSAVVFGGGGFAVAGNGDLGVVPDGGQGELGLHYQDNYNGECCDCDECCECDCCSKCCDCFCDLCCHCGDCCRCNCCDCGSCDCDCDCGGCNCIVM